MKISIRKSGEENHPSRLIYVRDENIVLRRSTLVFAVYPFYRPVPNYPQGKGTYFIPPKKGIS